MSRGVSYSAKTKREVNEALEKGMSYSEVSKLMDIPIGTIFTWNNHRRGLKVKEKAMMGEFPNTTPKPKPESLSPAQIAKNHPEEIDKFVDMMLAVFGGYKIMREDEVRREKELARWQNLAGQLNQELQDKVRG